MAEIGNRVRTSIGFPLGSAEVPGEPCSAILLFIFRHIGSRFRIRIAAIPNWISSAATTVRLHLRVCRPQNSLALPSRLARIASPPVQIRGRELSGRLNSIFRSARRRTPRFFHKSPNLRNEFKIWRKKLNKNRNYYVSANLAV